MTSLTWANTPKTYSCSAFKLKNLAFSSYLDLVKDSAIAYLAPSSSLLLTNSYYLDFKVSASIDYNPSSLCKSA